MDIILAPDVYVNASVAPATTPDRVVQRVLGQHKGESKATEWILGRVAAILSQLPAFKEDAVTGQVNLIRSFVQVVPGAESFKADAWADALVASARAANVSRVVTDHPDLLRLENSRGVEFLSTEAWLLEVTTPPPPPGS
ncbi:MAG TPA: hypothetical protein VFX59_08435 [Polyangiales bacterium]|nr:hypothetical protein [Polyangiales bacterium]